MNSKLGIGVVLALILGILTLYLVKDAGPEGSTPPGSSSATEQPTLFPFITGR